jgi:hypothetical protein
LVSGALEQFLGNGAQHRLAALQVTISGDHLPDYSLGDVLPKMDFLDLGRCP